MLIVADINLIYIYLCILQFLFSIIYIWYDSSFGKHWRPFTNTNITSYSHQSKIYSSDFDYWKRKQTRCRGGHYLITNNTINFKCPVSENIGDHLVGPYYQRITMKRKSKQLWWTIPLTSTKPTTTSLLKSLKLNH
jgi:hypothetical protein